MAGAKPDERELSTGTQIVSAPERQSGDRKMGRDGRWELRAVELLIELKKHEVGSSIPTTKIVRQ